MYYSVYDKFNVKNMDDSHKDVLLGEALSKLEIIKELVKIELGKRSYGLLDVTLLQAVLDYYPDLADVSESDVCGEMTVEEAE